MRYYKDEKDIENCQQTANFNLKGHPKMTETIWIMSIFTNGITIAINVGFYNPNDIEKIIQSNTNFGHQYNISIVYNSADLQRKKRKF